MSCKTGIRTGSERQAGEWWISKNNDIVRIVGVKLNGQVVYEMAGGGHSASSGMWPGWHHEPLCTSFDWQPIDPGDGWELLVKPCMLQNGDQSWNLGKWNDTHFAGTMYSGDDENIYRRRKPTAETWPKWYESHYHENAYVKRLSEEKYIVVKTDGSKSGEYGWVSHMCDNRKAITESEALARVKPAVTREEIAERTIERVKRLDPSALKPAEPIAADRIPDHRPARDVLMDVLDWLDPHPPALPNSAKALETIEQWLEDNHEPVEAIAHAVERTATPLVTGVVESPDDWVTQDRVPARPGIDDRRYHYSDGTASDWDDSASIHWDRPVRHGDKIGATTSSYVELRCRRRDLPAHPAPQPKRTPVDLIATRDNRVIWRPHGQTLMNDEQFIQHDADGFFVEGE